MGKLLLVRDLGLVGHIDERRIRFRVTMERIAYGGGRTCLAALEGRQMALICRSEEDICWQMI